MSGFPSPLSPSVRGGFPSPFCPSVGRWFWFQVFPHLFLALQGADLLLDALGLELGLVGALRLLRRLHLQLLHLPLVHLQLRLVRAALPHLLHTQK